MKKQKDGNGLIAKTYGNIINQCCGTRTVKNVTFCRSITEAGI
jgi:hypothetical protein